MNLLGNTENAPATKESCFEKYATPPSNELNSYFNNLSICRAKTATLYCKLYSNEHAPHKVISKVTLVSDLYNSKLSCLAEQQSNVDEAASREYNTYLKNWFHLAIYTLGMEE